jgi:hypothetical protein
MTSSEETMTTERLKTLLQNEPLIEAKPSIEGVQENLLTAKGGAIYYGTGLTTPRALSLGLPFDVLGMILVADKLRGVLGLGQIIHHIADTHALTNEFASAEAVDKLAVSAESTLRLVAAHLNLPQLTVVRSSSFDSSNDYQQIVKAVETEKGDYVRREIADMRWYRARYNLALKLGWIIQSTEVAEGFDERLYDREYRHLGGSDVSFVYLKAGRTFDYRRPKASPYIAVPNEQRILLVAGERVADKINAAIEMWPDKATAKNLGGAINHLGNIVRLYERRIGSIGSGTVIDKVQLIIDRIFNQSL